MIRVSYVVTVYNKAAYLPAVIQSLKDQHGTFEREFVFVNDGSTDNSLTLLQELTIGLENVKIIDQINQGVTPATNNGVDAASGDLIKLVDADDILAPFCTQLLLDTLNKTKSDFVFAISGEYDDRPKFEAPYQPEIVVFDEPLKAVIKRGFARVSHCLFKKNLFWEAQGCDPRIFSQDHSLFLRLSTFGKMAQVRHVVCASPRDEPGRIMNNEAQVIHDATLALAYHMMDHPGLPRDYRILAQKKILARIWKWAKKAHKTSILSPEFGLYLLSRCGMTINVPSMISLCAVFRKNAKVRQPGENSLS